MTSGPLPAASDAEWLFSEVEVRGHIIDSLILPKILDVITSRGGRFKIQDISIGERRADPSYARLRVEAPTNDLLRDILEAIYDHGAVPVDEHDCRLETADVDGAFPDNFYSTTNQKTEVRVDGEWIIVDDQEMDCGICVDRIRMTARCVPMTEARIGQEFVVGHRGVRVYPPERSDAAHGFEFMNSAVSTEKPKSVAVREVARQLFDSKREGRQSVVVAGPAVVHTGSAPHLCELIRRGYVQCLLAGNALATHDIEYAIFGTSLGVSVDEGTLVEAGHEHHLRAINRVRRAGSIAKAVHDGVITKGIMYECIQHNVDFVLAGSIRDDGPLPDVITDVLDAQQAMRRRIRDAGFCLMMATTLHSIAVGNLLPAWVPVVCIDINPSTVIKLNDRGSFQTTGIVTDIAPFLQTLITDLDQLEAQSA